MHKPSHFTLSALINGSHVIHVNHHSTARTATICSSDKMLCTIDSINYLKSFCTQDKCYLIKRRHICIFTWNASIHMKFPVYTFSTSCSDLEKKSRCILIQGSFHCKETPAHTTRSGVLYTLSSVKPFPYLLDN